MTNGNWEDAYLIRGRSNNSDGHGVVLWTLSCREFATGRGQKVGLSSYRGRPDLANELLKGLQDIALAPVERATMRTSLSHNTNFFRFLDEMEDVAAAAGSSFTAPSSVLAIPGQIWALYNDWLNAQPFAGQHYSYFYNKRLFDRTARVLVGAGDEVYGFPLPPNPYPNPQKAAARSGSPKDDSLSSDTIIAAADRLFQAVERSDRRISESRVRASRPKTAEDSALKRLQHHGQRSFWRFDGSAEESAAVSAVRPPDVCSPQGRTFANHRSVWLVPRQEDIIVPFCLMLMRTGWNTCTGIDMHAEKWAVPHPLLPERIMELYAPKSRANMARQTAYSSSSAANQSYQLVRKVLEWNRPLRDAVVAEAEEIAARLSTEKLSREHRETFESRHLDLVRLSRRVWLYLSSRSGVVSLHNDDISYHEVNRLFVAAGLMHKGKPLRFTQTLTRNSWAVFAYKTSGYNLLITQIALGHSDLTTLLHYLNQKAVRNQGRRRFFEFQSHVLSELKAGRMMPRVIRAMMERGKLSAAEVEVLARGGVRTRQGMICVNPAEPDVEVDPRHRRGEICRTQECLRGCSKAFATLETLEHVCARIVQLTALRKEMPIFAWTSSEYPHDLQFLETILDLYSEANRITAMKVALEATIPLIYTAPSRAALKGAA